MKKKYLIIWLSSCIFSLNGPLLHGAHAQHEDQSVFDKANEQYRQGVYDKALQLYEKVSTKDASVLYNMGNCAYRLKNKGQALLYWRKAEKLWGLFNKGELLANIALLKHELAAEKNRDQEFTFFNDLTQSVFSFVCSIPLFALQILFLLLWLFLFVYLKYLYKKKHSLLIFLLFGLIAFLSITLILRYRFDLAHYGVVMEKGTAVRSGPDANFRPLTTLDEATEVTILNQSNDFFKIRSGKIVGWASKNQVKKI